MRAHLEDLPEKDATWMFEAANRVLNQLLIEMDGMAAKKTVFIIGTTNMPDIINPELPSLRCIDQLIYIPFPDKASHLQIFKACCPKPRVPKNVDLIVCAQYTRVVIGANITEICLRACKYTTYLEKI
jgi:transitional endoplasmic reticulum ATPase